MNKNLCINVKNNAFINFFFKTLMHNCFFLIKKKIDFINISYCLFVHLSLSLSLSFNLIKFFDLIPPKKRNLNEFLCLNTLKYIRFY